MLHLKLKLSGLRFRLMKKENEGQLAIKSRKSLLPRSLQLSSLFIVCFGLVSSSCAIESEHYATLQPAAGYNTDSAYANSRMKSLIRKSPEYITEAYASDIQGIFKTPNMTRFDNPALVWHYASSNCAMDIYFKVENNSGVTEPNLLPVAYAEVRNRAGHRIAQDEQAKCVRELMDNPERAGAKIKQASL